MRSLKAAAAYLRPSVMVVAAAMPLAVAFAVAVPQPTGRPSCSLAAGAHHLAVVVEHGNGATLTSCISFDSIQLNGDQAMQMSGIQYASIESGGLGKAVCQIDREPTSYPPGCWTSSSPYWGMFVSHAGGPWAVARYGISSQQFSDGDALGWHYIPANGSGGPPPSPSGACTQPAPSPVPSTIPNPLPTGPTVTSSVPAAPTPAPPSPGESPSASPSETTLPQAVPSDSPEPGLAAVPAHSDPAHPSAPAGPDLGWLAAATGAGALLGLLVVRLLARRGGA